MTNYKKGYDENLGCFLLESNDEILKVYDDGTIADFDMIEDVATIIFKDGRRTKAY